MVLGRKLMSGFLFFLLGSGTGFGGMGNEGDAVGRGWGFLLVCMMGSV